MNTGRRKSVSCSSTRSSHRNIFQYSHCESELFYELCSTLYSDIQEANSRHQEIDELDIKNRQKNIIERGLKLTEAVPELTNIISSKLDALNRVMECLQANKHLAAEAYLRDAHRSSALSDFRKWVRERDIDIMELEKKLYTSASTESVLRRLAADQQIFQLQIETEGQIFSNKASFLATKEKKDEKYDERSSINSWVQRRQQHLEVLTKRWHNIWLRSLAVQFKIENRLRLLYQSDDEAESDPELRGRLRKRRRLDQSDICLEKVECNSRSEDNIALFDEDDCKSLGDSDHDMLSLRYERRESDGENDVLNYAMAKKYDTESQVDIGYASSENFALEAVTDTNIFPAINSDDEADNQRRLRISTSPVKSYYKTVPLDETGATDTETPRVSVSKVASGVSDIFKYEMHALSDSLIVNTESELDYNEDVEEVLSLMDDDDENGNPRGINYRNGTRWCEFRSGKYQQNGLLGSVSTSTRDDDKNSCDASSEESDGIMLVNGDMVVPPFQAMYQHSLKRRHKSKHSNSDRSSMPASLMKSSTNTLGYDFEASISSNYSQTCSEITYPITGEQSLFDSDFMKCSQFAVGRRSNKHYVRRKLRARRLPRSMSDGEQLGFSMNVFTHSAPGVIRTLYEEKRAESDVTVPEQSDAPSYEWDEYNPPAKAENIWAESGQELDAMSVMTIEDDFHLQLGELQSVNEDYFSKLGSQMQDKNLNGENARSVFAKSRRPVASVIGKLGLKMNNRNDCELEKNKQSTKNNDIFINARKMFDDRFESSFAVGSSLPTIYAKIEKFASSLKLVENSEENSKSSLATLSSIKSFDDVVLTQKLVKEIHDKLMEEQNELSSLLSSECFSGDSSYLLSEFEPLSRGYDIAINRVEQMMNRVGMIREQWNDFAETQRNMQKIMIGIESELTQLRKGDGNSEQIRFELEHCQERMNRLETVCNYLTSNLASLQDNPTNVFAVDFESELEFYSNAILQLRSRFEEEMLNKTPKKVSLKRIKKPTTGQKVSVANASVSTDPSQSNSTRFSLKTIFAIAIFASCIAWFTVINVFGCTLGPHLNYVNGPPPL